MKPLTNLNKLNRKEAYAYIIALREEAPDTELYGLDALLNYFAPAIPKKAKTSEQYVAKAINPKDIRLALCNLASINGRLYGCDGHKVHHTTTDLPDGQYDPKTMLPIENPDQYPDVVRILQGHSPTTPVVRTETIQPTNPDNPRLTILYPHHDSDTDKAAVNEQYLLSALNGQSIASVDLHLTGTGLAGVAGTTDLGDFLIMQVKI